jgi:PhoH-like ATPase
MILNVALSVKKESRQPTIVVSKDINVRIKANILGIESEDYYHNMTLSSVEEDTLFVLVSGDYMNRLYQEKVLPVEGYRSDETELAPYANDYLLLKNEADLNQSALVQHRKDEKGDGYFHLLGKMDDVFGIRPRNHKQRFLMDAIRKDPCLSGMRPRYGPRGAVQEADHRQAHHPHGPRPGSAARNRI